MAEIQGAKWSGANAAPGSEADPNRLSLQSSQKAQKESFDFKQETTQSYVSQMNMQD